MRHLAGYTEPQPWLTVGQVLDPVRGRSAQATRRSVSC